MRPLFGRSGDHFDSVVRAYTAELFHYALWLCLDRHRAEDVLQEALTRAWRNWNHLKDESARRAWLYSIVRNEFYRDAGRSPRTNEEIDVEALAALADERDFTRGREIRQLLERLPVALLEPLVMQSLAGLSCEEIARVMDVSVGATMTRLSRARTALRELVDEADKPRRHKESTR